MFFFSYIGFERKVYWFRGKGILVSKERYIGFGEKVYRFRGKGI